MNNNLKQNIEDIYCESLSNVYFEKCIRKNGNIYQCINDAYYLKKKCYFSKMKK